MRKLLALALFIAVCGGVAAGGPEKGDKEVTFRVAYSDTDVGNIKGTDLDLGSQEDTELSLSWGWFVTDRQELGFVAGYIEQDIDAGSFPEFSSQSDGTTIGGFYAFNFKTGGIATPYIGAQIATLGGDLGDDYDFQYAAEIGVKLYPFEHGGFSVGLAYTELRADAQDLTDADAVSLGAGLILKY